MKKFFSAFLLMAMMVASVGSFVSCSDIENAIAKVETSANNNATAIESLKSEVAALKTAVSAAQSAADAAMAAAKDAAAAAKAAQATGDAAAAAAATAQAEAAAAKAAAEQAKADALAAVATEVAALEAEINAAMEAMKTANAAEVEAIKADIAKLQEDAAAQLKSVEALSTELATVKASLEGYAKNLEELGLLTAENKANIEKNVAAIADLEKKVADLEKKHADDVKALQDAIAALNVDETLADVAKINSALVALQNRIQSVAYVPQDKTPVKATMYTVGEEETDYLIRLAYQVSPVSAAAELENAEVYVKGIAVKAEAPAEFETKVVSVDEATGMVEVLAYIPEETVAEENDTHVVLALAIENEAGVEITSAYETFACVKADLAEVVKMKDFNASNKYTHEIPYDTAIADSKVDIINSIEFYVAKDGAFVEDTPLAEALEVLGLKDVTIERNPANRFGTEYIKIENKSLYDNNATPTDATTDDLKVLKDTQSADKKDVTVEFSEDYAKVADATKLIGKYVVVKLKEGFFTIGGAKLPAAEVTYKVVGKENKVTIDIDDINTPWLPEAEFIDVPYTGIDQKDFNTYHDAATTGANAVPVKMLDADGKEVTGATVTIKATSHDDMSVKLNGFEWPEETATYTVKYEFKGAKDAKTETQTVYSYEFTITVEGRPEDVVVETTPSPLPVLTLTPMPVPGDPTDLLDKTPAQLASKVEVGAIVTELSKDYASYYEKDKLVAKIKAALESSSTIWTAHVLDIETDKVTETAINLINSAPKFTYVAPTATAPEKSVVKFNYDVEEYALIAAAKYIQIRATIELENVEYQIRSNAKVSTWAGPAAGISAGRLSPKFQGDQVYSLIGTTGEVEYVKDGNGAYKLDANGNKIVDWYYNFLTASKTANAYTYKTTVFNFDDYITVKNIDNPAAYYVRWYVVPVQNVHYTKKTVGTTTTYTSRANDVNQFPTFEYDSDINDNTNAVETYYTFKLNSDANIAAEGDINAANFAGTRYHADNLANVTGRKWTLNWGASKVASYTVVFELIPAPASNATEDIKKALDPTVTPKVGTAATVTFETPATIQSVNATTVELQWNEHAPVTANIAPAITVTDMFNTTVNNLGANRTLATFWDEFKLDAAVTKAQNTSATGEELTSVYETKPSGTQNYTKVYNQSINVVEFDHDNRTSTPKEWIVNNGGFTGTYATGVVTGEHFTFDTTTGQFTFTGQTAPANDVTFTVMVEVGHMNDNGKPIQKTVNIVVKK